MVRDWTPAAQTNVKAKVPNALAWHRSVKIDLGQDGKNRHIPSNMLASTGLNFISFSVLVGLGIYMRIIKLK